jgi:2-phosphoglycerate kinase
MPTPPRPRERREGRLGATHDHLRDRLRHVRWIGGGSGAGKSSIARRLAAEHGLRVYSSDETISDHARRSNPTDHPLIHEFLAMDMDERWVNRSPSVMLETFHGFQGELFEFIIEDLLALPADPPIVAEGFRLLPRLVAPLLSRPDQALWLIPKPAFRRVAFEARGFTWEIARQTNDPERALANLLERDALFTSQIAKEAATLHLTVIEVDINRGIHEVTGLVGQALGLPEAGHADDQGST